MNGCALATHSPVLTLYVLLVRQISHVWDNQDIAATIKRRLQLLLPGIHVFLDVDNLNSLDDLPGEISRSAVLLVLLGSTRYFESRACLIEIGAAKECGLPVLLIHESNVLKQGASIEDLKEACPQIHRDYVFGQPEPRTPIPWMREGHFQTLSLAVLAEGLLLQSPAYSTLKCLPLTMPDPGFPAIAQPTFSSRTILWTSSYNEGANEVAEAMLAKWSAHSQFFSLAGYLPESVAALPHHANSLSGHLWRQKYSTAVLARQSVGVRSRKLSTMLSAQPYGNDALPPEPTTLLLVLNSKTFTGPDGLKLAAEVRSVLEGGYMDLVLVHERRDGSGGCPFEDIISATPSDLHCIYDQQIAIPWCEPQYMHVSLRMLAERLGGVFVGRQRRWSMLGSFWDMAHNARRPSKERRKGPEDTDGAVELLPT